MPFTQRERMLSGEPYDSRDPELLALAHRARGLISAFTALPSTDTAARHQTLVELFGHVGEGNLHLNVLRVPVEREEALYGPMMDLIARRGGNVSSEHGVGSRKRPYLTMSREPADIAAMRTLKAALDPTGYLNASVLFD